MRAMRHSHQTQEVMSLRAIVCCALMSLVSCVSQPGDTVAFGQNPGAPRFSGPGQEGVDVAPGGNSIMDRNPEGFTAEEDIQFTNPDDPEASLAELSGILTDPGRQRGPWERSLKLARKNSIRAGKPLLIWFTNLRSSPRCKQLDDELFSQPKFQAWADDHLIRMRVNEGEDFDQDHLSLDQVQTMRVDFAKYVKQLKSHYKVLGYPSLVVVDPQGRVVGHHRGYRKGQQDLVWGRLRQWVVASDAATKDWMRKLEARGYREWEDKRGRKLIAKILRYDKGALHLVEPDGSRSQLDERTLSEADRKWIEEQKAKHR